MPVPSRPTRVLLVAALLASLLGGVAGCTQDDAAPAAGASAGTTTAYARYVALGDSYTAAPLVPRTDTSNACLRSDGNYPALVAAELPETRLVDVSCSGADTGSLVGPQQTPGRPQPPQLDAVTSDTDLVTVGIGGNDFGLFGTLIGTCTRLRASDPHGAPCRERLGSGGSDRLLRDISRIRGRVAQVVAEIRDRAPDARVVVVGYPQIIPDHGTCPRLLPLATGDYPYARRVNVGLAGAVERGARRADAYVDTFAASAGHDICADDPWVNGTTTDPGRALAYHPFAEEQAAVARLLLDHLG